MPLWGSRSAQGHFCYWVLDPLAGIGFGDHALHTYMYMYTLTRVFVCVCVRACARARVCKQVGKYFSVQNSLSCCSTQAVSSEPPRQRTANTGKLRDFELHIWVIMQVQVANACLAVCTLSQKRFQYYGELLDGCSG